MKRLVCLLALLPLLGCDRSPGPTSSPAGADASTRRIAELESRIDTLEQMIRALDRRDDRIADMAASRPGAPAPRPADTSQTRERIRNLDDDMVGLNRQMTVITEQLTALTEAVTQLSEEVAEVQTSLSAHEQVLERIVAGN